MTASNHRRFNPHPAIKQGATRGRAPATTHKTSFNPHPAIKQGATARDRCATVVSSRFNPHPAIKQGATRGRPTPHSIPTVSILTLRSNRVRRGEDIHRIRSRRFQSSPCDQTGCDALMGDYALRTPTVSILTLRSNRVRPQSPAYRPVGKAVSILTLRSNRVRRTTCPSLTSIRFCFNPHPAIKQGATRPRRLPPLFHPCFNPHPAIKQGATWSITTISGNYLVSILTLRSNRVRRGEGFAILIRLCAFQSSPCDQTGCDSRLTVIVWLSLMFQSSPCDQTGCDVTLLSTE